MGLQIRVFSATNAILLSINKNNQHTQTMTYPFQRQIYLLVIFCYGFQNEKKKKCLKMHVYQMNESDAPLHAIHLCYICVFQVVCARGVCVCVMYIVLMHHLKDFKQKQKRQQQPHQTLKEEYSHRINGNTDLQHLKRRTAIQQWHMQSDLERQ